MRPRSGVYAHLLLKLQQTGVILFMCGNNSDMHRLEKKRRCFHYAVWAMMPFRLGPHAHLAAAPIFATSMLPLCACPRRASSRHEAH